MVLQSQQVSFQGRTQNLFPAVISSKQYAYVIPDYEMRWTAEEMGADWPNGVTSVSRPTRNKAKKDKEGRWILGLPATVRAIVKRDVVLTERIQRWLHKRSCENAQLSENSLYAGNSFRSLWRNNAFASDYAGSTTHHDYINNSNVDAPDMVNKPMATSGALVEIVGSTKENWIVKAINVLRDDLEKYTIMDRELWYPPAISRRDPPLLFGRWRREDRVLRFDMYSESTMMWLLSNEDTLVFPKSRFKLLNSLEERPSIFNY